MDPRQHLVSRSPVRAAGLFALAIGLVLALGVPACAGTTIQNVNESGFFENQGVQIYFEVAGSGRPPPGLP